MEINKNIVAHKLLSYLQGRLSIAQLIDWAENAVLDGDFPEEDAQQLTQILGKIGLADVRAFGLSWDDCSEIMRELGYIVKVEVAGAA